MAGAHVLPNEPLTLLAQLLLNRPHTKSILAEGSTAAEYLSWNGNVAFSYSIDGVMYSHAAVATTGEVMVVGGWVDGVFTTGVAVITVLADVEQCGWLIMLDAAGALVVMQTEVVAGSGEATPGTVTHQRVPEGYCVIGEILIDEPAADFPLNTATTGDLDNAAVTLTSLSWPGTGPSSFDLTGLA